MEDEEVNGKVWMDRRRREGWEDRNGREGGRVDAGAKAERRSEGDAKAEEQKQAPR